MQAVRSGRPGTILFLDAAVDTNTSQDHSALYLERLQAREDVHRHYGILSENLIWRTTIFFATISDRTFFLISTVNDYCSVYLAFTQQRKFT